MAADDAIPTRDETHPHDKPRLTRPRPGWLLVGGLALVGVALVGLFVLQMRSAPGAQALSAVVTLTPTAASAAQATGTPLPSSHLTPTALGQAVVQRQVVAPPTRTPTPGPTSTAPAPTPPEIEWTQAERNALSWMCYGEVGGMAEQKVNACLSVISTVRARYAYYNAFSTTNVVDTLRAPGQFNVRIETGSPSPDPDLNWTVEQYQAGMRGTCNGYLYFNSLPDGPVLCTITSSTGEFMHFHNSW